MRFSRSQVAAVIVIISVSFLVQACVSRNAGPPIQTTINKEKQDWPKPSGIEEAMDYAKIPASSNAVAYDKKLISKIDQDSVVWADVYYTDEMIARAPNEMIRDLWKASNLSYSLRAQQKGDNDFILPLLNRSMLYISVGAYHNAFKLLLNAKGVMDSVFQEGGELGAEQEKIFKGEHYEKSLACFYMGMLLYIHGDYQNARAMFLSAIEVDRDSLPNREILQKWIKNNGEALGLTLEETTALYQSLGDDNRVVHYMLARTLVQLGDYENAKVELDKIDRYCKIPDHMVSDACGSFGSRLVKQYDIQPTGKDEFADIERLEKDNLVVFVTMGHAPTKYVGGPEGNTDYIAPRPYLERQAEVYVDGKLVGEPYPLFNMLHQATSTSRSVKDTVQGGKAAGKIAAVVAARFIPFIGGIVSDTIENNWSIVADTRRWGTAPNEVQVLSARVEPGLHTVTVLFYDINGKPLPHYEQTHYYVPVSNDKETVLVSRAIRDKGNAVNGFYCTEARSVNAESGVFEYISGDLLKNDFDPDSGLEKDELVAVVKVEFDDPAKTQQFIETGAINPWLNTAAMEQRFDSQFEGIRVIKVAEAKVLRKGKYSKCKVTNGKLEENQVYFITMNNLPFDDIIEISNHSFVQK